MENQVKYSLAHVGINADSAGEAGQLCLLLRTMFGWDSREGSSSFFAGEGIEIMKKPYLGTHGHIAIGVNDMPAAMAQLREQGVCFDDATQKKDAQGNIQAIYLKGEYGGFALHLVRI